MRVIDTHAGRGGSDLARLSGLGAALWCLGVASAHYGAKLGQFSPSFAVPLLLATLPLAWLTVRLVDRVGGATVGLIEAVALASMPALMLDGLAFTYMPVIYSTVAVEQRAAAAWLLWFVGAALAISVVKRRLQGRNLTGSCLTGS